MSIICNSLQTYYTTYDHGFMKSFGRKIRKAERCGFSCPCNEAVRIKYQVGSMSGIQGLRVNGLISCIEIHKHRVVLTC